MEQNFGHKLSLDFLNSNPGLFAHIVETSHQGIIITNHTKNGSMPEIIYANDCMARLCGYSIEELIGKQPQIFTGPETDLDELIRLGECLQLCKPGVFELLNYKKNGQKFWSYFQIYPIFDKDQNCTNWYSITRDITLERRHMMQLSESENKFRSLVEDASVGIYILVEKGILFANTAFVNILEYPIQELLNLPLHKIIHEEDYDMVITKIGERIRGDQLDDHYELRMKTKSGKIREIEIHGSRTIHLGQPAIIGTAIDITEKNKNRSNILKFSRVIEQSEASIVITDLTGKIEYVNPAFTRVSGYTLEEARGENPRILKTENTENGTHETLWKHLLEGKSWKGIFCNKKKNGELFWEQAVISPVFNDFGQKTNYVAVKEDITHRINLEQEKENLIEELSVSLNELKQFSYITSHNLRAPLTNLMGIIDLLDTSTIKDETTLLLIEGFKRSTHKLNETIQDLIKSLVLKENAGHEFVLTGFSDILQKTLNGLGHLMKPSKANIETQFDIEKGMFIPPYLESIFQNLITNSIKYAKADTPPLIFIKTSQEGKKLKLEFSDNGIGMDMEKVRGKIFGLYQKFHKNDDSKGIGLYLVKSHVHAMRGEISVNSEINKGTHFIMIFDQ